MAGGEQSCWGAALLEAHPALSSPRPPSPPLHCDAKGSLVGSRWPVGPGQHSADQDASLC